MDATAPHRRWFCPKPGWLAPGLLAGEGFLFLSERFHWFAFNERQGWTVLIALAGVGMALVLMLLWLAAALIFRRRFQFSMRSLFLLTVAVALPCSWLAVERKEARQRHDAHEAIVQLGGMVFYDYEPADLRTQWHSPAPGYRWMAYMPGNWNWQPQPLAPAWLRGPLGDDFFRNIVALHLQRTKGADAWLAQLKLSQLQSLLLGDAQVTDAGLEHLQRSTQLTKLELCGTEVTDAGLEHLKGLTRLEALNLAGTRIADAGLKHLKGLTQLQLLRLNDTLVTDAGLKHLEGLTQLEVLELRNTRVTDAGLEHVEGLTQLQNLDLNGTRVTDAGLEHLQRLKQLRDLHIIGTACTADGEEKFKQALPHCAIFGRHLLEPMDPGSLP